jgi:excisionase family DNA binding protein
VKPAPDDEARPLTVTVKEAVRLTGLARSTILKHLKAGTLHSTSVGRKRLVSFASLEAMVLGSEKVSRPRVDIQPNERVVQ